MEPVVVVRISRGMIVETISDKPAKVIIVDEDITDENVIKDKDETYNAEVFEVDNHTIDKTRVDLILRCVK